ncbi:MAG: iron-containing alcohol dehydrogenase [Cyclobacteriaceae bacterium]|nr:iron-containing alcohol dehydrogenase [Cyclobacteriaceae bacterium]
MKFNFARIPQILFGPGKIQGLPGVIGKYGKQVLLVTGKSSLSESASWDKIIMGISHEKIAWDHFSVQGEPSPGMIDACVMGENFREPDVVVAIGGGSVLDAGKAISAMWKKHEPVRFYLEGVGDGREHDGQKIPFIAIPTTAGTGSEATKNAVISEVGPGGFKRSLRHDQFVPEIAIIDPDLTVNCPKEITAWSGMDAFTQLLESYLSTEASPMTDALALSGLKRIAGSLEKAVSDPDDLSARTDMAYAALCSGITLANAGLGVVHGFASSIGGRFQIPHGLICGTLMGVANEFLLNNLLKNDTSSLAVKKYAETGRIFHETSNRDGIFYAEFIINKIHDLVEKFNLPRLSDFGFDRAEIENIARSTSCKYNPVNHDVSELAGMLERRV